MRVFRIIAAQHAAQPLSGIGAAEFGGRWNSPGIRMGYATWSRSLAILEMLVHTGRDAVPQGRVIIPIDVPDDAIELPERLPAGWNRMPYSTAVRTAGDRWVQSGRSLAWRVPSALVADETNLLINPMHPRFGDIAVGAPEPLVLDPRLFA